MKKSKSVKWKSRKRLSYNEWMNEWMRRGKELKRRGKKEKHTKKERMKKEEYKQNGKEWRIKERKRKVL